MILRGCTSLKYEKLARGNFLLRRRHLLRLILLEVGLIALVEAALLLLRGLPPPSALTLVHAGQDRACAWRASDRDHAYEEREYKTYE